MTRRRALVLCVVAAGAIVALLLLRGGDHSNPPVAHVGGQAITRDALAALVDHFRRQAQAEGTPFPADGSARFRAVRSTLLGLLVYRAELEQAAARLGVTVTRLQVLGRLQHGSGDPAEQARDRFDYDTARAQLLYEGIYTKVTRGVEPAARRNRAMSRYLARLKRDTKVRYEPGYLPGP